MTKRRGPRIGSRKSPKDQEKIESTAPEKNPEKTSGKFPEKESNEAEKQEEVEIRVAVRKKDPWMKTIHWSARILGIMIAMFWLAILITHGISMATLLESTVLASLIAVLLCAWRYEIAGGAIYILLGIAYLIVTIAQVNWTALLIVATPPLVTGGVFITEGFLKSKR